MRLIELLEDNITISDISALERRLNANVYEPEELVKRNKPVIELDLPTQQHFMDRIRQRSDKAHISTDEIEDLLTRAKTDPSMGYSSFIDKQAKSNDPRAEIAIMDPETKLDIPVVFTKNELCDPRQTTVDGCPVCKTRGGLKVPKNKMVAKTIYRKGVPD